MTLEHRRWRRAIASEALNGLLSSQSENRSMAHIAHVAVVITDLLLKELDETELELRADG